MSVNTAWTEIEHSKGTQFDPTIVDAFSRSNIGL